MSAEEIPNPPGIGRVAEGQPITVEQKEKIFARRERAVKMRSMGMPIAEIARQNDVSWGTARDDIEKHLRALARMSTTAAHRQLIAEIFLRTILNAEKVLAELTPRADATPEQAAAQTALHGELRLKALDRIQRAGESLMRTYGIMGPNPIVIPDGTVLQPGKLVFEGIDPKKIDHDKVKELRNTFIEFMQSMRTDPKPIDASFTIENGAPPPNGDIPHPEEERDES